MALLSSAETTITGRQVAILLVKQTCIIFLKPFLYAPENWTASCIVPGFCGCSPGPNVVLVQGLRDDAEGWPSGDTESEYHQFHVGGG